MVNQKTLLAIKFAVEQGRKLQNQYGGFFLNEYRDLGSERAVGRKYHGFIEKFLGISLTDETVKRVIRYAIIGNSSPSYGPRYKGLISPEERKRLVTKNRGRVITDYNRQKHGENLWSEDEENELIVLSRDETFRNGKLYLSNLMADELNRRFHVDRPIRNGKTVSLKLNKLKEKGLVTRLS